MSNPLPLPEKSTAVAFQETKKPLAGDCWSCRLLSGGGLMAAGGYVFTQAYKRSLGRPSSLGAVVQMLFSTGLSVWGLVLISNPTGRNARH